MAPTLSVDYIARCPSFNAEQIGKALMRISQFAEFTHLKHLFFRELGLPVAFTRIGLPKIGNSMMLILGERHPFKVGNMIIEAITILVIAAISRLRLAKKGSAHEPMDGMGFADIMFPQRNGKVTILAEGLLQYPWRSSVLLDALHLTSIADLVEAFKTGGIFPCFHWDLLFIKYTMSSQCCQMVND